ncbi:hypothetical protein [Allochromatium vinosum]|uniref:hypothetical protein n=1 Tax=Allochromatium vinosum TaxID=1049 RepID=UPI0019044AC2|nr:hypothetical protein [Allochromatium vinosum]
MNKSLQFIGLAVLGVSATCFAADARHGEFALSLSDMDKVTAGTLTFGPGGAFAVSESSANANGAVTSTATSSKSSVELLVPEGASSQFGTSVTATSGLAISWASGGDNPSKGTSTTGYAQQPQTSVTGGSINNTFSGRFLEISVESSLYAGSVLFNGLFGH